MHVGRFVKPLFARPCVRKRRGCDARTNTQGRTQAPHAARTPIDTDAAGVVEISSRPEE